MFGVAEQHDQVTWTVLLTEPSAATNYQTLSVRSDPPRIYLSLTEFQVLKLGLSIEPAEVRLITGADDLYTWQRLPEKNHLFKKQLSKHSIGAYRELCRGVGVSFEAVAVEKPRPRASSESDEE